MAATFRYLLTRLDVLGVAYVHMMEPDANDLATSTVQLTTPTAHFRPQIQSSLISNGGYDANKAEQAVASGLCDAVSFGVPFVANPDLPARLAAGGPLNAPRPSLLYGRGPEGYTDYPSLG